MTELTVEEIQEPVPLPEEPVEQPPQEPPEEPPELTREPPQEPPEPEVIEPAVPAPKRRGRPAGSKNKAKALPKRRAAVEVAPEIFEPEPPQIDVNALLEPIMRAYMATGELRKRQARQQRYNTLFQGMVG